MPNWCITQALVKGDAEQARELHDTLARMLESETPRAESDFGVSWLGNALAVHDIDHEGVRCRGSILSVSLRDDGVEVDAQTAWDETPLVLTLEAITRARYPKLGTILWYAEEPGCEYYESNDVDLELCPGHYAIEHCGNATCDTYYADTEAQALELVSRLAKRTVTSLDDVPDIEETMRETDPDAQLCVHEIQICEDA